MNVIDACVILFLLLGAVIGFKKGLIKSLVSLIGTFAVMFLSFYLRGAVGGFLMKVFPFINLGNGLTSLNVLIYQIIAFILLFILFSLLFRLLIKISGLIEKILNATIVLGIVSKILGAVLGLIESLVFIYIILFVMANITVTNELVMESSISKGILNKTPILSSTCKPALESIKEIYELSKDTLKNTDEDDIREYNIKTMQILIKYNLITNEDAQALVDSGKLDLGDVTFKKE